MTTSRPAKAYLLITLEAAAEAQEAAAVALFDCGAQGVVEEDLPGGSRLKAYFPTDDWAERKPRLLERLETVRRYFPSLLLCEESPLASSDWAENWKKFHRPTVLGPFWIGPPWLRSEAEPGLIPLIIDPGQAFGTGAHATTQLCLSALIEHLDGNQADSLLDVGTGSGVLALAGLNLGVKTALGLDLDPLALEAARQNALVNRLSDRLELSDQPLPGLKGRFPLVLANLTGPVIKSLANHLFQVLAPGGKLILSGILVEEVDSVVETLRRAASGPIQPLVRRWGDWAGVELTGPDET